jgi:hypothetical protein
MHTRLRMGARFLWAQRIREYERNKYEYMYEEHSDECMDDGQTNTDSECTKQNMSATNSDASTWAVGGQSNNEERSDECANEVRSALARSEDNNIVLSATIQQYYGRSIFMTRAKPSQGQ